MINSLRLKIRTFILIPLILGFSLPVEAENFKWIKYKNRVEINKELGLVSGPGYIDINSLLKTNDGWLVFFTSVLNEKSPKDPLYNLPGQKYTKYEFLKYEAIHCEKKRHGITISIPEFEMGSNPYTKNVQGEDKTERDGWKLDSLLCDSKNVKRKFKNTKQVPHSAAEILFLNKPKTKWGSAPGIRYEDAIKLGILKSKKSKTPLKNEIHKMCLDARDYEGCIKINSGKSTKDKTEKCKPGKWCKPTSGVDILGMPIIEGWSMKFDPVKQYVAYLRPGAQKVIVKGKPNRYFVIERLLRYYSDPTAGIAPTTTVIGSGYGNCYGDTSSFDCTFTPPTTITTPGISGTPGGIKQISSHVIVDCEDRTYADHHDNQLRGKWKKINTSEISTMAEKYCPKIKTLDISSFSKYAK